MKKLNLITLSITILITSCTTQELKSKTSEEYLLPKDLTPKLYDIQIIPYLETPQEKAFTFDGRVKITFQVNNATNVIRMHAYNMTVLGNETIVTKVNEDINITVNSYDLSTDDKHFLSFYLEESLIQDEIYTIEFDYIGVLNDDLDGFYRSSYNDSEFGETWLAATQFSPNGARRAFPCFDEPAWKAKFTLHIAYAPGNRVVSNMPEDSSSPVKAKAGLEDWTWSHRKESLEMSTFIVGFTVSPFASLLSNVDYRFNVWARRDVVLQGSYANQVAPRVLTYMENYTQVDYPLTKMDQVAIPDFAPNAMENWGMINYRETALLFEEGVTSTANRQRVATVISHEVAHQWFGNLVSPAWWGYVWLKEGFARYFEYHALAKLEPDWQLEQQFVQAEMRTVFQGDAINTTHALNSIVDTPAAIFANFDNIAYNKGACIIRFLVNLMGENNFKVGINSYLTQLAYKNAMPHDLWNALSPFVPENLIPEGSNLTTVMDTWVDQAGYPVVTFERDYNETNKGAKLTQTRFLTIPAKSSEKWAIPLTWTSELDVNISDLAVKAWLMESDLDLSDLPVSNEQWILLNVQQTGYYRVNYDVTNWQLLSRALEELQIDVINRAQLMDDALTLARASLLDYTTALDTTSYLNLETEYVPWQAALAALRYLGDRLNYDIESRDHFQWYIVNKLGGMYETVGEFNVSTSDSHVLRLKRSLVLGWLCAVDHKECNSEATELFSEWRAQDDPDLNNPIDPDLKTVVYCGGIRHGYESDYHFLFNRYISAANYASEQSIILTALGCSTNTNLLERYLLESISNTSVIRPHDARSAITAVYNNYAGVDVALDFLLTNFEQASKIYGGFGAIGKVFAGLSSKLNTKEHKQKLVDFRESNLATLGEALTAVDAAITTVDEILAWHETHSDAVLAYFIGKRADSGADLNSLSSLLLPLVLLYTALV